MKLRGHNISLSELVALRACARSIVFHQRSKANATLGGAYYSHFRGRGMDFDEVRLYQPGDDLRSVDWRVTARRNVPHTKVYREERERPVYLVVDFRPAMYFGTRVAFKSVIAAKIAALLSWAAIESGDRVGAVLMTVKGPVILHPQGRQKGALLILKQLAELTSQQPNDYNTDTQIVADTLGMLQQVARPNGLVFMISDFQGINSTELSALQFIARKQQLFSIMVYDALEAALPEGGQYTFAEGANRLSIHTTESLCHRYSDKFELRQAELRQWHHQHNAQWMTLRTDQNILSTLRRYL
jgi:uncharacterized protein (DUF58 family)